MLGKKDFGATDGPLDEELLRAGIAGANIPTLLMVLVHLTGDTRWLEEPYRPTRVGGLDDNPTGGLDDEIQDEIREAALQAVLATGVRAPSPVAMPDEALLVRMLSSSMGEPVPAEYGPMIADELTRVGSGIGRVGRDFPATPVGFNALIVGAGASGIAAARTLQEAGVDYSIIEKHDSVGGTWLENRYPGCGVDTPSALYSFSFAQNDWAYYFADAGEIRSYLRDLAKHGGVDRHIRFRTELISARWDEHRAEWIAEVKGPDGEAEEVRTNILISAVGAFSRPQMPPVPGLLRFDGPCVHTARWPDGLNLSDKRVAVIGNGASAMQIVPTIAEEVSYLGVFQRVPQWAAPFDQYRKAVPDAVRYLARHVPLYRAWYRVRLGWLFNDHVHAALQKDPDWPHPERSVNKINDAHRRFFTRYIREQLGDREDLIEQVIPDYPPYGKRILLDHGWYRTLLRENVELFTGEIREATEHGLVTPRGTEVEFDVIICATGFDVVRFLAPIEIIGRSGSRLHDVWDEDDARAFLGLTIPGFPNFFVLYGPNTQAGHGGSLFGAVEMQLTHMMNVLAGMFERSAAAVDVRRDEYERYNAQVDEAHERMVWTHPGMDTYYRNSQGRVVVNSPFRIIDSWHAARATGIDEYELLDDENNVIGAPGGPVRHGAGEMEGVDRG